jgi:hypothetical protein
MNRASGLAALIIAAVLCACAPVQMNTPAPPSPLPASHGPPAPDSAARATCTARGGAYAQVGLMGIWTCVTPYADGGRVCTDKSQCAGACIFAGSEHPHPGAEAQGECQRTNVLTGCFTTIESGRATYPICVD